MYHGTPKAGFTTFKTELEGSYFTADRKYAEEYAKGNSENVYSVYLNITKPFDTRDPEARRIFQEEFYRQWGNGAPLSDRGLLDWTDGADMFEFLQEKGYDYDGIVIDEGGTPDGRGGVRDRGISYVAFSPEQVKNVDNLNPTSDPDIRFSLSNDSDGKKLTKEQSEYFKDSKMRDENGNLKVMYHGSQDAGFHVFDGKFSDDDMSFFFVDRNDVAASYSGTSETYEAQTIRTAEDMNKFIESIGVDGYEVVENGGKFTLLYEGDRIADSNTAQGIYDEFCWYEGVGEGDANYKVYLNLTNPLVVDGKGRPWNKIDAEFSQEVYDRYQSLTTEEKAALTDLAEWEDFRIFNSEIQEAQGNELASAYAKMGEDVNIYDLFSVAADNFSEESMRENARRYLKTRDMMA